MKATRTPRPDGRGFIIEADADVIVTLTQNSENLDAAYAALADAQEIGLPDGSPEARSFITEKLTALLDLILERRMLAERVEISAMIRDCDAELAYWSDLAQKLRIPGFSGESRVTLH